MGLVSLLWLSPRSPCTGKTPTHRLPCKHPVLSWSFLWQAFAEHPVPSREWSPRPRLHAGLRRAKTFCVIPAASPTRRALQSGRSCSSAT
eukprot:366331-Chlamydomonas_euryale.AAC.31